MMAANLICSLVGTRSRIPKEIAKRDRQLRFELGKFVFLGMVADACLVFVAKGVAVAVKQVALQSLHECEEDLFSEFFPEATGVISLTLYALAVFVIGFVILLLLLHAPRESTGRLSSASASGRSGTWRTSLGNLLAELIKWSFKGLVPIAVGQLIAALAGGGDAGVSARVDALTSLHTPLQFAANALLALILCLLAAVASSLVLPPLKRTARLVVRCASSAQAATSLEGEADGVSEGMLTLVFALPLGVCVQGIIQPVFIFMMEQRDAANLSFVVRFLLTVVIVLVTLWYTIALTMLGGRLFAAGWTRRFPPRLVALRGLLQRAWALLVGWSFTNVTHTLVNTEVMSLTVGYIVGAVTTTFFAWRYMSKYAAAYIVDRTVFTSGKPMPPEAADAAAEFAHVAGALAIGWSWEELSGYAVCALQGDVPAHVAPLVAWGYVVVSFAVFFPVSLHIDEVATRRRAAVEARIAAKWRAHDEAAGTARALSGKETGGVEVIDNAAGVSADEAVSGGDAAEKSVAQAAVAGDDAAASKAEDSAPTERSPPRISGLSELSDSIRSDDGIGEPWGAGTLVALYEVSGGYHQIRYEAGEDPDETLRRVLAGTRPDAEIEGIIAERKLRECAASESER